VSIPVQYCDLLESLTDEAVFRDLHSTMQMNLEFGGFSIFPCEHDPPCRRMLDVELGELLERFRAPLPEDES
jgi:hypothetical protein